VGRVSVTGDLDIHDRWSRAWRLVFLGGAVIHRLHAVTGYVDIRQTESKEADMRKLVLTVIALLSLASVSYAQTSGKIATVWKCAGGTPMNPLPVGDAADHIYGVQQTKCTAVSGELAGLKQTEGVPTEFVEATGASSKGHGIFVETMSNGDKIVYSYDFTGTSKNKMMDTGSNKFTVTSGTGRFKGMTGGGTCKAKGNPDGSAEFTCSGTYSLAK